MKTFTISLLLLFWFKFLGAQPFSMVKDINTTPQSLFAGTAAFGEAVEWNGYLYYSAFSIADGQEPWKTNISTGQTSLVKDINTGLQSSSPSSFIVYQGQLYFNADDGIHGSELWISDGTDAGTRMIKDIVPGLTGGHPVGFVISNGILFFVGNDQLWKTDGTPDGTLLVKAVSAGLQGGNHFEYQTIGGVLYFVGMDAEHGRELWRSDGSSDGTYIVRDINDYIDPVYGPDNSNPANLTVFNGALYFSASDRSNGTELWRSDGSAAGTILVKDINTGPDGSSPLGLHGIVNGRMVFTATTNDKGGELWVSDGTGPGTQIIRELSPGSLGSNFSDMLAWHGLVYFIQNTPGSTINILWSTDGTDAGTIQISQMQNDPLGYGQFRAVADSNQIFFNAYSPEAGREIWVTKGTSGSTHLLRDVEPGNKGSQPIFMALGSHLFFQTTTTAFGLSIWMSDGTEAGTRNMLQLPAVNLGSAPTSLMAFHDHLLFAATDSAHGSEIWTSDGTQAGTYMVKDIIPGSSSGSPMLQLSGADYLYFTTNARLWRTDGTESGTINLQPNIYIYSNIVMVNGLAYFSATYAPQSTAIHLWKSDGTVSGTVAVNDLYVNGFDAMSGLFVWNNDIYFFVRDFHNNDQLEFWKFNSAASAISQVKMFGTGIGSISPIFEAGGKMYFSLYDPAIGPRLWTTDGTSNGTAPLDLFAGKQANSRFDQFAVNGKIFMPATDASHGAELWVTDGTAAGTMMVKDINPGPEGSYISHMITVNGTLFFDAYDPLHGEELWRSDGTDSGTVLVQDTWKGVSGNDYPGHTSKSYIPMAMKGKLVLTRTNGIDGEEPWISDGTDSKTLMLQDIVPGSGGSGPGNYTVVGDRLYFTAMTPASGTELWSGILQLTQPPTPQMTSLENLYCQSQGRQQVKLMNLPGPMDGMTVKVWMDSSALPIAADSTVSFDVSSMAEGAHQLSVRYSNIAGEQTTNAAFHVDSTVTPQVSLAASQTVITDPSVKVQLDAIHVVGGGTAPLYTFARDRDFTQILQAEGVQSSYSLDPALLAIGVNWIYLRLRTSAACYTRQTTMDSVKLERGSVTGIVDPDYPGSTIRVYPNPFHQNINIDGLQANKSYRLRLIDVEGHVWGEWQVKGRTSTELHLGAISAGACILTVVDGTRGFVLGSARLVRFPGK